MTKNLLLLFVAMNLGCSPASSGRSEDVQSDAHRNSSVVKSNTLADAPNEGPVPSQLETNATYGVRADCEEFEVLTKKDADANFINIVSDGKVAESIKLPRGIAVNGFSLNYAKKTENGFMFSIEYGSRFYYYKEFRFTCRNGTFYLTEILVSTHDQADPENSGKESTVRVEPNQPLGDFSVTAYMKD